MCARRVRPLKRHAAGRGEEKSTVQGVKDLAVGLAQSVLCVLPGPTQPGASVKRRDCASIATPSRRASTATSAKNAVTQTRLRTKECAFDHGVFSCQRTHALHLRVYTCALNNPEGVCATCYLRCLTRNHVRVGRIENSPPPESIQWSEHTTLADCVDDGTAEDDAHFQVPHGMIRLGSCQAGSAEGLVKLPTPGKWMIEFYVGIPQYKTPVDARPGEMGPDFFPVEDDAQTEPSDQVDVEIAGPNWDLSKGGVKTTFGNVQTSNEIPQKRLVMTFVEGDSFKFRFKFRSKQDVVNAHMFVNDGFATYVDDLVRGSHLSAGKTLEAGKGSVTGYVMNAVNGKPLLKSHRTSDGYTQDGLQLPNSNPTFELLVGSAEMKDVEVKDSGKFDVTVKAGEWTCRVSERGFMDFWDDACDVTAGETRYLPIPLSPLLNPGHARFVLTWGHEPQDLELSLTVPGGCKVDSFNRRCTGPDSFVAHVERDTSHGYGPESLAVLGFWDGEYTLRASHFGKFFFLFCLFFCLAS